VRRRAGGVPERSGPRADGRAGEVGRKILGLALGEIDQDVGDLLWL